MSERKGERREINAPLLCDCECENEHSFCIEMPMRLVLDFALKFNYSKVEDRFFGIYITLYY